MVGVEPTRPCGHRILSPARLPIPPHRHNKCKAVVGFEPAIRVLQTRALPLGYTAIKTGVAGFEPTNHGVKVRCLTAWLYPKNIKGDRWESNPRMSDPQTDALTTSPRSPSYTYKTGTVGIEPTLTVLETVVLPLN